MALEELIEVVKVLVPPAGDDVAGQTRWRWVVFSSISALVVSLTVHIVLSCGYFPAAFPGFALATDTKAIQRRIDVIATLALEREMRAKAQELCKEKDYQRRNELNDDISRLQHEYHDIVQQWYAVPRCDQL